MLQAGVCTHILEVLWSWWMITAHGRGLTSHRNTRESLGAQNSWGAAEGQQILGQWQLVLKPLAIISGQSCWIIKAPLQMSVTALSSPLQPCRAQWPTKCCCSLAEPPAHSHTEMPLMEPKPASWQPLKAITGLLILKDDPASIDVQWGEHTLFYKSPKIWIYECTSQCKGWFSISRRLCNLSLICLGFRLMQWKRKISTSLVNKLAKSSHPVAMPS